MPTLPSLKTETDRAEFKTSNQSMWTTGAALSINDQWTLFSQSLSDSFSAFDGDLSASAAFTAALILSVQGTAGGVSLHYPIDVAFNLPNSIASGQQFTVGTSNNGLASGAPHFDAKFPEFDINLDAIFSAAFNIYFNSDFVGPYSYDYSYNKTIPLISLHSGDRKSLAYGFDLYLPKDYDKSATTEQVGSGTNGQTLTLNVATPDIASVTIDLISLIEDLLGPELPALSGSLFGGDLTYDLIEANLTAGIAIAQQFQFVPSSIELDITAPWGARTTVPLGMDVTFEMPENWSGSDELSAVYVINGNLINQTGFSGNASLAVNAVSGHIEVIGGFGPLYSNTFPLYNSAPIYVVNPGGPSGFALDGFNSPDHKLHLQGGSGSAYGPGDASIDLSGFSANEVATIQGLIGGFTASGSVTGTNLYRVSSAGGGGVAELGKLNVERLVSPVLATLDPGFVIGLIGPDGQGGGLTGNGSGLLAAAPGAGKTATLTATGSETMIAGQQGNVTFNIGTNFSGSISGLEAGDSIAVQGLSATAVTLVGSNLIFIGRSAPDFFGFSFPTPVLSVAVSGDLANVTFQLTANPNGNGVSVTLTGTDSVIQGYAHVYLEGGRTTTRSEETNLGDLAADAGIYAAHQALGSSSTTHVVGLLGAASIKSEIGDFDDDGHKTATSGNADIGKPAGSVSQADVESAVRDSDLMLFDTTAAGLKAILEYSIAAGPNQARFLQVGGIRYSYDPDHPVGSRIVDLALVDESGKTTAHLVENGVLSKLAPSRITVATTSAVANDADGLPVKEHGSNFRFLLDGGAIGGTIDETRSFTSQGVAPGSALDLQEAMKAYMAAHHGSDATAYDVAETSPSGDTRVQNLNLRSNGVFEGKSGDTGNAANTFLTGDGTTQFILDVKSVATSFASALGVYKVAADGTISDVRIVFNSTAEAVNEAPVSAGMPDKGVQLGFFLIHDGYKLYADELDDLSFVKRDGGGAASITDTQTPLLHNGSGTVLDDSPIFHSFANLNAGRVTQVLFSAVPNAPELDLGFNDSSSTISPPDFEDIAISITTRTVNLSAEWGIG